MKRNTKESGFGLVAIAAVLALLLVAGLVGWRVYDANSNKTVDGAARVDNKVSKIQIPTPDDYYKADSVGEDDSILDPMDIIDSYSLPQAWTNEGCTDRIVIVPSDSENIVCTETKSNAFIYMAITDNFDYIDPENCEYTKTKMSEPYDGFVSYDCEDIEIDGKRGLKEVLKENEKGYQGEATYYIYTFPADGQLLALTYVDAESRDNADYLEEFDTIAASFQFR